MMKMFRRTLIIFVVLIGIGYGAAEVYAKSFAEKSLAENAAAKDPIAQTAQAKVSAPLIWGLLTKSSIDRIEISTQHVQLGPILGDRTTAVLTDVHIDRKASIRESEPIVDKIGRLDMSVEILQEEASKLLPNGVTFEFTSGNVAIKGPLGVSVDGKLVVRDGDTIAFEPKGVMPRGIRAPSFKLGDIPFVSCLQQIEAKPGRLRITCSQKNPPATFPP